MAESLGLVVAAAESAEAEELDAETDSEVSLSAWMAMEVVAAGGGNEQNSADALQIPEA